MPDIKPFNCFACLSFWIGVIIFAIEINFLNAPIQCVIYPYASYLIADLIMTYEKNL